jgi:hypothetical protein
MLVTNGPKGAHRPTGDRDVQISGVVAARRFFHADLLERFQPHIALVRIGSGARSSGGIDPPAVPFRSTRAPESARTAHLGYELSHPPKGRS